MKLKVRAKGLQILKKRYSLDVALNSILINCGKLAFPTFIYICYKIDPKKIVRGMIVATISIIVVLSITSYLENIRQNILKKKNKSF